MTPFCLAAFVVLIFPLYVIFKVILFDNSTVGTSFIMNGRAIKSINRLWNKSRAELQSKLPKNQRTSNLIRRLTLKRNNRVNDCVKKTARYIVNHCIENNIGTIVCGYNPDFKSGINLGKKTNQQFT